MKKIKVMACILAVTMLAGIFAGCSKTTKLTTKNFVKACEKLKLEEVDFDDGGLGDELEDGFYTVADEERIEDDPKQVEYMLNEFGLDGVIDEDDVKSIAFAAKVSGIDDFDDVDDPEDLADVKFDGAMALLIELDENYVTDVMEYIDDMLDTYDVNTKNLTSKEYYSSKNDGYYRIHIDVAKLGKLALENEDLMDLISMVMDEDDFEDLCKDLTGDFGITFEVNGSSIFMLVGCSLNTKPSALNSFASAFKVVTNPTKVPMNDKFIKGLIQDTIDNYGDLAGGYDDYDYDYDDYDFDDYDYDDDDDGI